MRGFGVSGVTMIQWVARCVFLTAMVLGAAPVLAGADPVLTPIQALFRGDGMVDGLDGATAVVTSPDGDSRAIQTQGT